MFKSLWKNFFSSDDTTSQDEGIDRDKLLQLLEHFPIGKKIRYSPEFQRDIIFDTIIIAHIVDGHWLYSRDSVRRDDRGTPMGFLIGQHWVALDRVRKLLIVVPDTSDMERTLDYFTRAALGRGKQFAQGNFISLFAKTNERGVPTVDTTVETRSLLKDGPYADTRVIALAPDFGTITILDQRRKQRLETHLVVSLYREGDNTGFDCILGDFSEASLRLNVPNPEQKMPPMLPDAEVFIVIRLDNVENDYRIKGNVFRANHDTCVVRLTQIYKDGEFAPLKMMDVLEIKTNLINNPT